MTEKRLFVGKKTVEDRFTIILDYDDEIGVKENWSGDVIVLKHRDLNSEQFVGQLVLFLNDQNEAIHQSFEKMEYWSDKAIERIKELENENEQLKERIKELEKNIFLCIDCEYCGNVEIGCLCNHNDDWVEFVTECDDFKKELYE